jgi:hypothetical protein
MHQIILQINLKVKIRINKKSLFSIGLILWGRGRGRGLH